MQNQQKLKSVHHSREGSCKHQDLSYLEKCHIVFLGKATQKSFGITYRHPYQVNVFKPWKKLEISRIRSKLNLW